MKKPDTTTVKDMYMLDAKDALDFYKSRPSGLDQEDSLKRAIKYGPNELKGLKKKPIIFRFFAQFRDLMIILLIISAFIALYLDDSRTFIILIMIVIINALIGFVQEFKADKVMESLMSLVVPEAKVYRNGSLEVIDASNLVPGDVIYVEDGDAVPADCRILREAELATNDFALTGESNPCRKFTHAIHGKVGIGDRRNQIFMGTTVASGNADCLVFAIGMQSELGRIASMSQAIKAGPSTLQREMNDLAFRITIATIILAIILVFISLGADLSIKEAFLFAISIASAMIPQGLPAEVNTALTEATGVLAKQKALVKKLSAVETLGATSIICTDKTGTLTKNEMTVEHLILHDEIIGVSGIGYEPVGKFCDDKNKVIDGKQMTNLKRFISAGYFASNAKIFGPDSHHPTWYCLGDPTEGALIALTRKAGLDIDALEKSSPELKEFPFDSVRKRMSSVRMYDGELTVFVKGAPESVLEKCTKIWLPNGEVRDITQKDKDAIDAQNDLMANKAMRNLAYAYKNISESVDYKKHDPSVIEFDLIYMGMVSMIDPVRKEVPDAMVAARKAHVSISIITGDYAVTAKAIALRAKLADHPDDIKVVEGKSLVSMQDSEILALVLRGGVVFSRVSPEDKMRIVGLTEKSRHIVAVTGDGINDAPALKRADIGVAMGKTGTDVAKQSADIILLDDSFHTLVSAISQGRTVYQNIKKATLTCLTSNYGELVVVLVGLAALSLAGIPPAITPVLILSIDLIAELFPIAALGWDKPDEKLMDDEPRNVHEHIFNMKAFFDLAFSGLLMGSLAYGNYLFFAYRNEVIPSGLSDSGMYLSAITLTYVTMVLCQLVNVLIRRSRSFTISPYLFTNRHLWLAMALSLICVLAIVYIPLVQQAFGSGPLAVIDWFYAFAAAFIYFVIKESFKLFNGVAYRRRTKTV